VGQLQLGEEAPARTAGAGVVLIGEAGEDTYLTADLEPGAYVMTCFIRQGVKRIDAVGNEGAGPDHDHRSAGMVTTFAVSG
jgi:hypothetical protein